jgi:phosphohistidine phosphatase
LKRLLILRHAKAVPHGAANDFDRVLAEDGHREMEAMARHLATLDDQPDLALVSPSARTRETWARCRLPDVPARFEDAIYESTARALLRLVLALPDEVERPILVGHNPEISEFAETVPGGPRSPLPTAALALVTWDGQAWARFRPEDARCVSVVTPASLSGAAA